MSARDIDSGFYPSFTIRIFRFHHSTPSCGVNIASHGPEPWEIGLIYIYLLSIHYLWPYSTSINGFSTFCSVCPSPDRFSAQNSKMWQRLWELRSLDLGPSLPESPSTGHAECARVACNHRYRLVYMYIICIQNFRTNKSIFMLVRLTIHLATRRVFKSVPRRRGRGPLSGFLQIKRYAIGNVMLHICTV